MASTALAPARRTSPLSSSLSALAGGLGAPFRAAGRGLKAAAQLVFQRSRWGASYLWGAWRQNVRFDYQQAVGDGLSSSILVACLNAIADQFPEPPPRVYRVGRDGEAEAVPTHPLVRLLRRPNPFMTWEVLAKWVVYCQHLTGNAYLFRRRSGAGRVVELWPLHPAHVEPKWPEAEANTVWISHYEYRPNSEAYRLAVEDVLHLPLDLDADNPRKGRAPLRALFAELFTDQEAAAFTAALLRNMGVPGVILTPDPAAQKGPDQATREQYKAEFQAKFGGDRRGEPMVLGGPMKVNVLSFSPEQMNLEKLRLLPESRVSAVLGVPAIVAGLKVGLDRGTYANAKQLREHFVESKMVPYWRLVAGQLTAHLLPDFGAGEDLEVRFDLTDVRALQEDADAQYKRLSDGVRAGALTVNDWRRELGFPELPTGDVLFVPTSATVTRVEDLGAEPEPVPGPLAQLTEVPAGQGRLPAPEDGDAEAEERAAA